MAIQHEEVTVCGFDKDTSWKSKDEAGITINEKKNGIELGVEDREEGWCAVELPAEEARRLFTKGLEMCDFLEREEKDGD